MLWAEIYTLEEYLIVKIFYSDAVGSYAENQKITAVRRVYQRGCVNPMINIEQLWKDYVAYEQVFAAH